MVADRHGYRRPLVWAGLATSVFAFLRPVAGSFPVLLVLSVGLLLPQPFLITVQGLAFEDFEHNRGTALIATTWELHPAIVTLR